MGRSIFPREYHKQWSLEGLLDFYDIKNDKDFDVESIEYDSHLIEKCLLNLYAHFDSISIYGIEDYNNHTLYLIDKNSIKVIYNLFSFMELEDFALEGLSFLTDLNGKRYSELDGVFKRKLRNININLTYFIDVNGEELEKLKILLK